MGSKKRPNRNPRPDSNSRHSKNTSHRRSERCGRNCCSINLDRAIGLCSSGKRRSSDLASSDCPECDSFCWNVVLWIFGLGVFARLKCLASTFPLVFDCTAGTLPFCAFNPLCSPFNFDELFSCEAVFAPL